MKILILGGAGMLGHKMVQRLTQTFPDTWWTLRGGISDPRLDPVPLVRSAHAIEQVDAMDLPALEGTIRDLRPDVVINCLGVIKQRAAASAAVPSITINALLPHRLSRLVEDWGGRFIHFSTDCVFNGRRGNYTEDDPSDAEDLYGRSKFLGEVGGPNALTLRTSIIGRELHHHQSLLDWFLSQNHGEVRGFRRAWWSGVTTNHLADLVADLLSRSPALHGMYQVSSERISKYDLLLLLRDAYALDVTVGPDDVMFCDRSLNGSRFEAATGYRCPSWPALIEQLASDPTPYPSLTP